MEKPETNKDTSDVRMGDIWAGISGMQGYRGEMEDAHIHEILDGDHLFLGVFDGHGGKDCAQYVCAVRNPDTGALAFEGRRGLVQVFKETPEWKQYVQGGKKREDFNLLKIALERAFMDIDHEMEDYLDADRNRNTPFGGCTACTVLITPHHIICANAGDSRATMSYVGSKCIELSQDHKPHNKDELERIKNAGGYVQHNRIDGNLAVSRGLGDFEFKLDKSRPPKDQKVSCVPDFRLYDRKPLEEEMIIIACDGLWDVYDNDQAIEEVRQIWREGESNMQLVAEEMLDKALERRSEDNISAIIVRFPNANVEKYGGGVAERRRNRLPEPVVHSQEHESRD